MKPGVNSNFPINGQRMEMNQRWAWRHLKNYGLPRLCTIAGFGQFFFGILTIQAMDGDTVVTEGFTDHGIAADVAQPAWGGRLATVDSDGRRVLVAPIWTLWTEEGRRGTSFLFVDVETGETEQTDPIIGDAAFSTFLSPENKLYYSLNRELVEVDVDTRTLQRVGEIPYRMPLRFTTDDNGIIYAGMFPNAEVLAYDPQTEELKNYGPIAEETWPQYPFIAVDDEGWIYAAIRHKRANLVGFLPETGERRSFVDEDERVYVDDVDIFRAENGRVYVRLDSDRRWRELYGGEMRFVESPESRRAVYRNATRHPSHFGDGSRFSRWDIPDRRAEIEEDNRNEAREVHFDYESEGARIYSLIEGPEGKIYGATGIPLRIFAFDPETESFEHWGLGNHSGHVNAWAALGEKLYGAVYSSGSLIEYSPHKPFDNAPIRKSRNPLHLYGFGEARELFGRPHDIVVHSDGRHVILAGRPARAMVGGGILIYDTKTRSETVIRPENLVSDQATNAIVVLEDGDLIGGTTAVAATGGERVAEEAVIYRLDWEKREVVYRTIPIPNALVIHDLLLGPNGLILGISSNQVFFVFDPEIGEVVHKESISGYGENTGSPGLQSRRVLTEGPDGMIYALFRDVIVRIDPDTFKHIAVGRPGVAMSAGLVVQQERLFFAAGSRLWSFDLGAIRD